MVELTALQSPELGPDAYQQAAAFVALRTDAEGNFRFDKTLLLCLKTAWEYVENETGLAFLEREYLANGSWNLPLILPISLCLPVRIVSVKSNGFTLQLSDFNLAPRSYQWQLRSEKDRIENAELKLAAGFEGWSFLPNDIRMSVLQLTAYHFNKRDSNDVPWPKDIRDLLANYRAIRLGFCRDR